jgi:hypothetical protein
MQDTNLDSFEQQTDGSWLLSLTSPEERHSGRLSNFYQLGIPVRCQYILDATGRKAAVCSKVCLLGREEKMAKRGRGQKEQENLAQADISTSC